MHIRRITQLKVLAVVLIGISATNLVFRPLSWVASTSTNPIQSQTHIKYEALESNLSHECANWIPQDQRKILLVGFKSLSSLSWMDGEYELATNVIDTLLKLGFQIYHVDKQSFENEDASDHIPYHRIVYLATLGQKLNEHNLGSCKMLVLLPHERYLREDDIDEVKPILSEKQLLTVFPLEFSTNMWDRHSFQPLLHNLKSKREKRGTFLIFSHEHESSFIFQMLLDVGIELHAVYTKTGNQDIEIPSAVIVHDNVSPEDMLDLLSVSSFLITFGVSIPTLVPRMTMTVGASLIILNNAEGRSQMPLLSNVGTPYVYNANIGDAQSIMQAVKQSIDIRFTSYSIGITSEFEDTMCALVEDDSVCSCELAKSNGDNVDCRSSFQMEKQPVFPQI